jgi:hypothetical protein
MISKLQGYDPAGEFDAKAVTADMCLGKNRHIFHPNLNWLKLPQLAGTDTVSQYRS